MKIFGERLRELRTELNLTAMQLAKELKVSDSTIIRWENATSNPSDIYIVQVAQFFKVSPNYLLGYED